MWMFEEQEAEKMRELRIGQRNHGIVDNAYRQGYMSCYSKSVADPDLIKLYESLVEVARKMQSTTLYEVDLLKMSRLIDSIDKKKIVTF